MTTKLNLKQSIMAGLMAAVTAILVNSILFFAFKAGGIIVDTIFVQPNEPLTIVPVIISSFVPTVVASLVFFLLEKYTANGFKIFRIVSIILLVISFINPFMGIPGVTVGYALVLDLMHVSVVVGLLYFIGKKVKENS